MAAPLLTFYTTAGVTLTTMSFGTLTAGQESSTLEVVLWNNKDGTYLVDDAINCLVSARVDSASEINDPLDNGWVYIKSDGTENPDSVENFFDDDQPAFTQITRFNHLSIGDIPEGCGRHLFVKVVVPTTAPSQSDVTLRLVAGTGIRSYPLPYFFNRAFGDGVVHNIVSQIFPPILQQRVGTWNDVTIQAGGAYTGKIAKDYLIRVASGTTIGYLTYQTSDDNGSSYSSAITSSTSAFTAVYTSNSVSEGVTIQFTSSAGQSLAVGDLWKLHVDTEPFAFIPGISTSLEGFFGYGEALVYNNRVFQQTPTRVSGLTASDINYIFMDFQGDTTISTSGNPQYGKILLGMFTTNTTKVIEAKRLAPYVTMGLDLFDDFGPVYPAISGLTFVYGAGKYKHFNEIITLPTSGAAFGTISVLTGGTNYIQIDPIQQQLLTTLNGYLVDNIPLFRIGSDNTYITKIEDDRARIGVTTYSRSFTGTVSNVSTGSSKSFYFDNFVNRGEVKKLVVTPTQLGGSYNFFLYEDSSFSTLEYSAENLTGVYTDPVSWWHNSSGQTKSIFGRVESYTGLTTNFTFDFMKVERFA